MTSKILWKLMSLNAFKDIVVIVVAFIIFNDVGSDDKIKIMDHGNAAVSVVEQTSV
jgi:hypothetical protein